MQERTRGMTCMPERELLASVVQGVFSGTVGPEPAQDTAAALGGFCCQLSSLAMPSSFVALLAARSKELLATASTMDAIGGSPVITRSRWPPLDEKLGGCLGT
jgi:hypothetical protein